MASRSGRSNGAFNFGITVNPSPAQLAKAYGLAPKLFDDWRPEFNLMAPHIARGLGRNIQSKGATIGERWEPAAKNYLRRKQREGHGRASLILMGRLIKEVTSPTRGVLAIGRRSMRFGSDLPYARAANFGRKRRGALPFMGWSSEMDNAAETIFSAGVRSRLDRIVAAVNAKGAASGW